MRTHSSEKKPKFSVMGGYVAVHFNEEVVPATDEKEEQFVYDFVKVLKGSSRSDIISSIIKLKYPNYDAEIAAMANGGQDSTDHQEWRSKAKVLADELVVYMCE